MRVLPFPGASRKRELVNQFEDLKNRVTATLGQGCKLFHALKAAVHSKRRTDIWHVLAVYESQPYVVLDRIWSAKSVVLATTSIVAPELGCGDPPLCVSLIYAAHCFCSRRLRLLSVAFVHCLG